MAKTNLAERRPRAPPEGTFEGAIRETKAYAARIRDNPPDCPMFPIINRSNGAVETLCYMQGYLAGRIESTGKRPTREQMGAIRHDVMHDNAVRDVVVGMQDSTLSRPGSPPLQREY